MDRIYLEDLTLFCTVKLMQKTIQGHTLCFCGTIVNDDEYYYSMKKGIAITDHVTGELI
jgi:hypothetical protein